MARILVIGDYPTEESPGDVLRSPVLLDEMVHADMLDDEERTVPLLERLARAVIDAEHHALVA